jgi:hypothetical protein
MKEYMSKAIEVIIERLVWAKRGAARPEATRLTGNWQTGLESAGHVQRRLRLGFSSVRARQPAN